MTGSISRRFFLKQLGLSVTSCLLSVPSHASSKPILLQAQKGEAELLGKGLGKTKIWGYSGKVPGPILRVKQDEELFVRFKNDLDQPSTVHWHGVRIKNSMDGVAGLTQSAVEPGASFDYRFHLPDAGTYWYHPHNRTWEQMARGLYGLLIVEEPHPIKTDHDIALAIDDWRLQTDGQLNEKSFGRIGEWPHGGRIGNILTINGKPSADFTVQSGDRVRLRLCNTANARILNLRIQGCIANLIALDGQPIPPRNIDHGIVTLAPSQRADLLLDMDKAPGSMAVISEDSNLRLPLIHFNYHNSKKRRPEPFDDIPSLTQNPLAEPDRSEMLKIKLDMSGGAMGRMQSAFYKGKELGIRELASKHKLIWAFNGVAGMPIKPLFSAKRGQTVELEMINNSAWPHAMHMHGHHMREIQRTRRTRQGTEILSSHTDWRDTVLINRAETVKVIFKADNPGKWMLHCHMLEHQAGGMMTWFEVN